MRSIKGCRIALIGGAGFIGHHLALKLASLGADVTVVDSLQVNNLLSIVANPAAPNQEMYLRFLHDRLRMLNEAKIKLVTRDARDYLGLSTALNEIQPEVIVHLAAVAHANIANKDPYSTFDHSLRTLENALDVARVSVKHFIYLSSSMVYGNFVTGEVKEETACEPLGIYGALKFAGEKMVIAYNQVFGLPYTIIRPSALYGERCVSQRVGQIFIENAIRGLEVSVNGDGSDRLDFTYVADFVDGVLKVIENPNSINQIFNLTYGESRSIAEMADILVARFRDVSVKYLSRDNLTPARGTLCVDKAKSMLGYNPTHPLDIGFVNYIEWYRQMLSAGSDGRSTENHFGYSGLVTPISRGAKVRTEKDKAKAKKSAVG